MQWGRAALCAALVTIALAGAGKAETRMEAAPQILTTWKAVYARIEARDRVPARARLGGILEELSVTEGDEVTAGEVLGRVRDEKLDFRLGALDAQLRALASQLENAEAELRRGEELLERGVTTAQRLDALRTQVDVLTNQIGAAEAERRVLEQQVAEGAVLSPLSGRVLDVPVAAGAFVAPGEVVASIGGGGFFLRLAVPERHAGAFREGDTIQIGADGLSDGRLTRVYPQIENGRVIADVEVAELDDAFVDARVLVRLPVGERSALLVPEAAVETRAGLDFLRVAGPGDEAALRTVVLGERLVRDGTAMVEVVTGLAAGETVVTP